jgi:hypothetical protein
VTIPARSHGQVAPAAEALRAIAVDGNCSQVRIVGRGRRVGVVDP